MQATNYYQSRINKSLKYINDHLSEEINIKRLADESNFSLFHFQRIFKALMNETPYDSILRLRLEKSIFLLKYRPAFSIAEVAYESGFASPENFSRQFKARYKLSPSAFKKNKQLQNSRIYQEQHPNDFYLHIANSRQVDGEGCEVFIEELPEIKIAFTRAVFGADGQGLLERYHDLIAWAEEHGINYQGALTRFGMSIDNPEVTPVSKYRYDFALRVTEEKKTDGIVEFGRIPAGLYATVHAIGKLEDVARTWDCLYKHWLPQSSYVPLHYPAIEEFVQGPEEIGWERFNIKCRIPLKKIH